MLITTSGGGFYSNTDDLTNFGKAILGHQLLTPSETRKWMKPTEHTSSLGMSVGGPWEIMRTHDLTSDGRVIDLYTKSGALGFYNGMLVLIPEFDLTFALLMGGPEATGALPTIGTGKLVEVLIPALDAAAREDAKKNFAGTYIDDSSNSTVTLVVDDGPGLLMTEIVMRDVDFLESFALAAGVEGGPDPGTDLEVTPRLYSSGLQADNQVGFRGIFEIGSVEDDTKLEETLPFIPDVSCTAFSQLDRTTYGMNSIEEFVFSVKEDGCAEAVDARFWRVKMGRQEESTEDASEEGEE